MEEMKPGKLPHDLLAAMLARLPEAEAGVVIGPRVGEDAAVMDLGERLLVAAMDPITFATDLIGWYAVHVNANDVAAMGAAPRWFLATLLLPKTAREEDIGPIFDQLATSCREVGAVLVGGHTEVTIGVDRPVMAGCMLGEVARDKLLTSAGARAGDAVILAGTLAIEGTAILAREAGDLLLARGLPSESVARAKELLLDPGISVVPAARAAASVAGVTAMHDPTEGGIATGLRELALASQVGLAINGHDIPILSLTREICGMLELDPFGTIASGSLLITAQPEAADTVVRDVRAAGTEARVIGEVLPEGDGLWLQTAEKRQELPEFPRDEIARFFDSQEQRGS